MWVITRRAKYYTIMAATVWEALVRMEEAEGKKPPQKLAEAPTHKEAETLMSELKKREQEVKHAGNAEVCGRETSGGETRLESSNTTPTPAAGHEAGVSGTGHGSSAGNAPGLPGGAASAPLTNRMDAGQDGLLPADWAQEDVLIAARDGGDGMPVFTGELFMRRWPREAKIVVNLRFAHGFSMRDIAKVVGCSPQTVSNICATEIASRPAEQFRKAMADRLRGTAHNLLMLVQERVANPDVMDGMDTKELVVLLEKTCGALRQMETEVEAGGSAEVSGKPKEKRSEEELAAAEMAEISGVYQMPANAMPANEMPANNVRPR
jgi:transcriptional regulator with XRE-family HTH domain